MKRLRRGAAPEPGCLQAWAAQCEALAGRWREARGSACGGEVARQLRGAFGELLLRMQGLPPALPTMPLELTVLYNSLLFVLGTSDCAIKGEAEGIRHGLLRVLEACGTCGQDLSTEELWQKVLQEVTVEELQSPLHRLAALQAAWWLAASCLQSITDLFRLLSRSEDPGRTPCSGEKNELLALLKAWRAPAEEASISLVQSTEELKETLCTAAAFLQGLQELEAGNLSTTLCLLQEAAGGFCSKRVLALIYVCLGCCAQRMCKPQTALQHLKRALQVDFQCHSALLHTAAVYQELGETDAELQALSLLYEALERNPPSATSSCPYFLIRVELLVNAPILVSLLRHRQPSEVKYLLAQRCLQDGRVADAVEHYLDFLALLQEGLQQQVPLDGDSLLPRIPEVFLEAASALEQGGRHQDSLAVCDEVISRTTNLIPQIVQIEEKLERPECASLEAGLAGGLPSQKRESLCCLMWRAAAYLHQGWVWTKLGKGKEALMQFSRCLNELLRFQPCGRGVEPAESLLPEVKVLQKIRLLSLIGRGMQFLEQERHKEALLDFQHGLQISPDDPTAAFYLVQVLWKLNRKQEASDYWQKYSESPAVEDRQQERPFPLYLDSCLKQAALPQDGSLVRCIQDYLRTTRQDSAV
ncbi:Fanconi anemia group G protein isoform X1 [Coturnix japonica]|uniref:FA complementation group G n=1 Tax=Coturnix japonica TaxID=93934 RepID=A0A8C2Y7S3_COTJA|nr:Fanconi anemia group G protein isoform X1 [Coturnix japonica]